MTVLTRVASATPDRPPSRPSRLLWLGLLAGPLFTVGYLTLGAVHDGYSAWRDPISSLASGAHGWWQVLNFVGCGLLVVLFAAGLRRSLRPEPGSGRGPGPGRGRRPGSGRGPWSGSGRGPGSMVVPALVTVSGVGLVGSGAFLSDLPGAPQTWHGQVHNLAFSLPGFAALILAMAAAAATFARRGDKRFAVASAVGAVVFAALFGCTLLGLFGFDPWATAAGLWQRLCVSTGFGWLAALAVRQRSR